LLGRFAGNLPSGGVDGCLHIARRRIDIPVQIKLKARYWLSPSWLEDVIWFTPAMRPNCLSRGVATAEAMVSGLAPGRPAETEMTGNSTWGRGATGRN